MRKIIILAIGMSMTLLLAVSTWAGENLVETVQKGCESEINTYCKDVTPGEGRVLACLYAREDKLSGKCEYALYDAAAQLERAVATMSYLINECADDLHKLCKNVEAGEGRLLDCLDTHAGDVSKRCTDAMAEVAGKK